MASKSGLIAAVSVVSAMSVVSGTFLAYRANQTATPVIEATTAAPEPVVPVPAPDAMISVAPPMVSHPPAAEPPAAPSSASSPSGARREKAETARPRATAAAPAPRVDNATAPQPVTSAPPPVLPPDPTPAATAASATVVEAQPALEARKPRFEEVVVKQDSVVGIQLDQSVSSETARIEDRVTAKITRDVTVDGRTAIAAGTRLEGVVSLVERGGKFRRSEER